MMRNQLAIALLLLGSTAASAAGRQQILGPRDGLDLPPVDTGRVGVGDTAPDFALRARDGSVIALSDYRGRSNVILVFYRGYW